jgi:hypothetical protein
MPYVIQKHQSQYQTGTSAITRSSGCTWTSGCNGVWAVTNLTPSPDAIHKLVKRSEETSPATPGWSMQDLDRAMARLGVPFTVMSGTGWKMLTRYHDAGRYIVLQGDSDRFRDNTCSGAFNGDHAVGVHPAEDHRGWWWIDDPICKTGRWEDPFVLRQYGEKLAPRLWYGIFKSVPRT